MLRSSIRCSPKWPPWYRPWSVEGRFRSIEGQSTPAPSVAIPATGLIPSHSAEESDRQVHATPTSVRCSTAELRRAQVQADKIPIPDGKVFMGRTDSRSLALCKKRVFSRADEYVLDYPTRYFYLLKCIDEGVRERMKISVGRSRYQKAVMAFFYDAR
jgi:hypothetical protein